MIKRWNGMKIYKLVSLLEVPKDDQKCADVDGPDDNAWSSSIFITSEIRDQEQNIGSDRTPRLRWACFTLG